MKRTKQSTFYRRELATREREAHARLIAAAPELLEALKGFVDILSTGMNQAQFVDALMELNTAGKQAIAKAEGRT
jgi:hypothetical protein